MSGQPFEKVIIHTPGVDLTVDQEGLKVLAYKISKEANSGKLKRELLAGIRAAVQPAKAEAAQAILSWPRAHVVTNHRVKTLASGAPLRAAIAGKLTVSTRVTGASVGAKVVAKKTGMPRGFEMAARRTNATSWRHPVFGSKAWIVQVGKPGWFDDTLRERKPEYRAAVLLAMARMRMRLRSGV